MATIRPLTKADAATYREIRLEALKSSPEAFSSDYEQAVKVPLEQFADRIHSGENNFTLGAFEDSRIIATGGFYRETHLKMLHRGNIWGVYVKPEHRGRGIAKALCRELIARARGVQGLTQVHITVVTTSQQARSIYESLGFIEYGKQPRALRLGGQYYDEDLLVLFLDDDGDAGSGR